MGSLYKNDSGAIVIMGVVMAVFLVALLYYAVGIGDAIMYRENMQDGADAAAFSAAVVHARGMNMLVMLNMIMAALLAILVALKLISAVCIVVVGLLAIASFWGCLPCSGAIAPVKSLRDAVETAYDQAKDPVFLLLEVLHCAEIGIRYGIPVISQARVVGEVSPKYRPPMTLSVIWPIYAALPVEDDSFKKLCDKAGEYAGELASIPFQPFGIGFIIKDPIAALARTFPDYFCGDSSGEGEEPSYTYDKDIARPRLDTPAYDTCFNEETVGDNFEQACEEAKREVDESYPTGENAECTSPLCEQRLKRAREDCEPKQGKKLKGFMWYEREVTRYYTKDQNHRVYELEDKREYGPSQAVGKDENPDPSNLTIPKGSTAKPPCNQKLVAFNAYGPRESNRNWTQWNSKDLNEPVCHEEFVKPDPWTIGTGEEIAVKYREIQHVAACIEKMSKTVGIDETLGEKDPMQDSIGVPGTGGSGDGNSMTCFSNDEYARSPQRVLENAVVGEEDFQLRAIALGKQPKDETRPLLKLAAWGKDARSFSTALMKILQKASVINIAQAEFYFNDELDREEWMWHMKWRARLRRFRLPIEQPENERQSVTAEPAGACFQSEGLQEDAAPSDSCEAIDDNLLEAVNDLILH